MFDFQNMLSSAVSVQLDQIIPQNLLPKQLSGADCVTGLQDAPVVRYNRGTEDENDKES